jgi:hypothetical protein
MQDAELGKTSTKMLAYNAFYGGKAKDVNVPRKYMKFSPNFILESEQNTIFNKIAGNCAKRFFVSRNLRREVHFVFT